MSKEREDILELKPGYLGISVNLRAAWRRAFSKKTPDPVLGVPERFIKLFQYHGVAVSQIPRLVPAVSLEQLLSHEKLLSALTPQVIQKTAELFRIRREWLEGTSAEAYENLWCYKHPERFFEEIKTMDVKGVHFPVVALCTDPNFDAKRYKRQSMVLVLRERCADLGERQVLRYRIFNDEMDWSYWKCRIQIKAMIRLLEPLESFSVVPLFCVSEKELEAVESGCHIPHRILAKAKRLHDVSLEDFSLFPDESAVSKAGEELPHVLEYIKATRLEDFLEDLGPLPNPYA